MGGEMTSRRRTAAVILCLGSWALAGAAPRPADPATEYAARAEGLGDEDPQGWLELATFAEDHLLWNQRVEALRKVVTLAPDHAEAHQRLDEVRVGKAWLPADQAEAHEIAEGRAKGLVYYGSTWLSAKEAWKLRAVDRKAVGWDVETRVDTPHLRIYSARALGFTRKLAATLENESAAYQRFYGGIWKLDARPKPLKVYVFRDRHTYERILTAETGQPPGDQVVGTYDNLSQTLYTGVVKGEEGCIDWVTQTAVHEMFHAMDDLLAGVGIVDGVTIPPWIAEGRAVHFCYAIAGRQVLPGKLNPTPEDASPDTLGKALASSRLSDLMGFDGTGFNGQHVQAHYALSWAWVYFLFHGEGGRHAAGFRAYLAGCPGKSSVADFEKAVSPISKLDPAFKDYVKQVLLPAILRSRAAAP